MNRNFKLLWVGKLISQLGDKFYSIALAWWILKETGSPAVMGFFLLVSTLPGILIGMFAGVAVDRFSKKWILIWMDLLRGLCVMLIAMLAHWGILQVKEVFLISVVISVGTAFFDPAAQSLLPLLVSEEERVRANSLSQMASGICTVAGPLLGALAVSVVGVAGVFFFNSISFALSGILAMGIRITESKLPANKSYFESLKEGLSFVRNREKLLLIFSVIGITHFFVGNLSVLLPFLAKSLRGEGVQNLGLLETALGAGLLFGAFYISHRKGLKIEMRSLIKIIGMFGLCFMGFSLTEGAGGNKLLFLLILSFMGACVSGAFIFWQTLLQENTPEEMRGRVFSISALVGNVSLPLAYGFFGVVLQWTSILRIFEISFAGLILLWGLFYTWWKPRKRKQKLVV